MAKKLSQQKTEFKRFLSSALVFNKTIIPLMLVGYELMIADSVLRTSSAI